MIKNLSQSLVEASNNIILESDDIRSISESVIDKLNPEHKKSFLFNTGKIYAMGKQKHGDMFLRTPEGISHQEKEHRHMANSYPDNHPLFAAHMEAAKRLAASGGFKPSSDSERAGLHKKYSKEIPHFTAGIQSMKKPEPATTKDTSKASQTGDHVTEVNLGMAKNTNHPDAIAHATNAIVSNHRKGHITRDQALKQLMAKGHDEAKARQLTRPIGGMQSKLNEEEPVSESIILQAKIDRAIKNIKQAAKEKHGGDVRKAHKEYRKASTFTPRIHSAISKKLGIHEGTYMVPDKEPASYYRQKSQEYRSKGLHGMADVFDKKAKKKDKEENSIRRSKSVKITERTLTEPEKKEKEHIVKGIKRHGAVQGFKDRYGKDWKSVMYATATARAKGMNESVNIKENKAMAAAEAELDKFKNAVNTTNDATKKLKKSHAVYQHLGDKSYHVKPHTNKGYDGHKLVYVRHYLGEEADDKRKGFKNFIKGDKKKDEQDDDGKKLKKTTATGSESDVIDLEPKMDTRLQTTAVMQSRVS